MNRIPALGRQLFTIHSPKFSSIRTVVSSRLLSDTAAQSAVTPEDDQGTVKITEKQGKAWHVLNERHNASLVQTVSGDFDMLNGLHREFVKTFDINQAKLRDEGYELGSVAVLENGEHFVYLLVIRENWWDRGAYRPLRESLHVMKQHALSNGVDKIAMGRLGGHECGLDFREVRKELDQVFHDTDISFVAYVRTTT